jgi:hypothetical protein
VSFIKDPTAPGPANKQLNELAKDMQLLKKEFAVIKNQLQRTTNDYFVFKSYHCDPGRRGLPH